MTDPKNGLPGGQTELETAAGVAARPSSCVVYVAKGCEEDRGRQMELDRGTLRVGTGDEVDLQLHDTRISKCHVELAVMPDGIDVRDLGSTNGTFFLGNRIQQMRLQPGAVLRLGKTELVLLPREVDAEPEAVTQYGELVGISLAMRRVFGALKRLQSSEVPILIRGETGTGKEVVARTVHATSVRRAASFVVVDCGSIAPGLIDSELFGHVRGSFTGANTDRVGAFEAANGGTLFLDEIGEMPMEQQPRLLRALESGTIRRVGETRQREVDVRVLAATNQDLDVAVKNGRFRSDLFYRLAVVQIVIPPLRDRPEDVPFLAVHLARQLGASQTDPIPPSVLQLMARHDWPGNVRELRNAVQRLICLGGMMDTTPVAQEKQKATMAVDASRPFKEAKEGLLNEFERAYLEAILAASNGNVSKASRAAGIARSYFRELMAKHGISGDVGE